MSDLNSILRRSSLVDTSGSYPARGIQIATVTGGGVYTQVDQTASDSADILHGRVSLGILGAFILGAVAFYIWTHDIQGGG
jgi:hypothetical protein